MRAGQAAEGLGVRQALAGRRDGGLVPGEVHVAVAVVQVEVLGLHRRGQHDVGVVDRVGRELLDHDGEQVLARERRGGPCAVRVAGDAGWRRRRHSALTGGSRVEQAVAEAGHRQRAHRARAQVVARERGAVAAEVAARWSRRGRRPGSAQSPVTPGIAASVRSAMPPPAWRWMPIVARIAGGPGRRASRSPSATIRSAGRPEISATRVGRELGDPLAEGVPADACASRRNASSCAPRRDHHVEQPERERGVGARAAARGARRPARRCGCGPGRSRRRARPSRRAAWMNFQSGGRWSAGWCPRAGSAWTRANVLRVHAAGRADRVAQALAAGDRADGQVVPRGAEHVPEPRARRGPRSPGGSRACRCPGTARSPRRRARRRTPSSRSAISSSASSQLIRSNRPSPLRPTRRSGCRSRSGARVCSR